MELQEYHREAKRETWKGSEHKHIEHSEGDSNFAIREIVWPVDLAKMDYLEDRDSINRGAEGLSFALLGFACDEGVSRNNGRAGAIEGPQAIRQALANINTTLTTKTELNAEKITTLKIFDLGDIACENQNLEEAQLALAEGIEMLLTKGFFPIVLGGGHEVAFGHFQGIAPFLDKFGKEDHKVGIINFDAHFDLRPVLESGLGSSGTPFLQIANYQADRNSNFDYLCLGINKDSNMDLLFDTAKKLNVTYFTDEELEQQNSEVQKTLNKFLEENDYIYLSTCLDVFHKDIAPGVSAQAKGGIKLETFMPLLEKIIDSKKIISFDIAEMSPKYDANNKTAELAASIIFELIKNAD